MKNRLGIVLVFLIATFIHLGDLSEARICPPKGNGVIKGIENNRGGNAGSNVSRVADTKKPKDKPLIAQPSPAGEEKKPTKTEEQLASLKDLKDKTGGAVDLFKPKADAKKGKPDKGKTGIKTKKKPEKKPEVEPNAPPLPPDDVAGGGTDSGTRLSHADRERVKTKYGAEDVVGTKGDVFIQKNGKWMRPEEIEASTDTAEGQGDDPTKDLLYASAQNLWEAKQLDRSTRQPVDYGLEPERSGSGLSKKIKDIHKKLTESKKEEHKGSSTKRPEPKKPEPKCSDSQCEKDYGPGWKCNEEGKCVKKSEAKPKILAITPANKAVKINEPVTLQAILKMEDGSTKDVTQEATWNPGNPFSKGNIGQYTVKATYKNLSGTAMITVVKEKGMKDITVNSKTIDVTFFDHKKEDGDMIDILINGKVVFSGITLTNAPQSKSITMNADVIVFGFKALNVGDIPPNTATVIFTNVTKGEKKQQYRLEKNQKTNMNITYSP